MSRKASGKSKRGAAELLPVALYINTDQPIRSVHKCPQVMSEKRRLKFVLKGCHFTWPFSSIQDPMTILILDCLRQTFAAMLKTHLRLLMAHEAPGRTMRVRG